jgi:hypothetical protein
LNITTSSSLALGLNVPVLVLVFVKSQLAESVIFEASVADINVYPAGGKYCVKLGLNVVLLPSPVKEAVCVDVCKVPEQVCANMREERRLRAPVSNMTMNGVVKNTPDNWILRGFILGTNCLGDSANITT